MAEPLKLDVAKRLGAGDSPSRYAGCVMVPDDERHPAGWPVILAELERAERLTAEVRRMGVLLSLGPLFLSDVAWPQNFPLVAAILNEDAAGG